MQFAGSLFSVVAHIRASDGSVACRFSYDAYGRARVHLPSDFNGDGVVNATDLGDTLDLSHGFLGAYTAGKPSADINGDGEVDASDEAEFSKSYDADAERSTSGPGAWGPCVLRIGFCGYVQDFNYQTHWLARNRWYESDQGRWLTRDPAGYIDGLSMYMYVRCNPFGLVDPMGLGAVDWLLTGEWSPAPEVRAAANKGFGEGAHDGALVFTNSAAKSLTFGAVGKTREELAASGTLYDPNNPALAYSETLGTVAGTSLQTALTGGMAAGANCTTLTGKIVTVALEAKVIHDRIETVQGGLETIAEGVEAYQEDGWSGVSKVALTKGAEVLGEHLAGKATEKFLDGIVCFESGTPVWTDRGPCAIDQINVGDRVLTGKPDEGLSDTEIDPASCRIYVLELNGDPQRAGTLELLRSAAWLKASLAETGLPGVWVHLEIEEWVLDGAARVLAVKPCPPIKDGPGRVVLMKSTTRYTGEMATVKFTGSSQAITGTFGHPVYSVDRDGYVELGDLKPGERVRAADGWATVESLCRSWTDGTTVHNLEVDADHRYLVGELRVDSHNGAPRCSPNRGNGGRGGGPEHAATQGHVSRSAGGDQEVSIPNSGGRIADNVDDLGRIHQIGDMRTRGGEFRPSARERGAIEDMRAGNRNATIIYHDKLGISPSLINPDLQENWKPAPARHRKRSN